MVEGRTSVGVDERSAIVVSPDVGVSEGLVDSVEVVFESTEEDIMMDDDIDVEVRAE